MNRTLSFGVPGSRAGSVFAELLRVGVVACTALVGSVLACQLFIGAVLLRSGGQGFGGTEALFGWIPGILRLPGAARLSTEGALWSPSTWLVAGTVVASATYSFVVGALLLRRRNLVQSLVIVVGGTLLWMLVISLAVHPGIAWLGAYVVMLMAALFCRLWPRRVGPWALRSESVAPPVPTTTLPSCRVRMEYTEVRVTHPEPTR